jgi:hypothetical protein
MGQHGWWHACVGNGTARRGGRVVGWVSARVTQRRSGSDAVKGTRGVGILSVRRRRVGELDRVWLVVATRSAWCIRSARLGSWRLDEAERGGAVALTAVDRCSRAT